MVDLIEYTDHPPLHEPLLVVALDGWIDAGLAAAGAVSAVLGAHDHELVASFDNDVLLDHRARRPMMSIRDGVSERLVWPAIELRAITDDHGNHVLLLGGAEPDHMWAAFTDTVVRAALDLDVRMIIGLGAYPSPVPHTRDVRLSMTSPSPEVIGAFTGYTLGSVEVPAGIQAAVEVAASAAGIPSLALWAQVPHYISGMAFPSGSLALIEHLNRVGGVNLRQGDLAEAAAANIAQLNELVGENDQHQQMLRQLEQLYDDSGPELYGPLPTGDELAAELQAFLRDHRPD